MAGQQVLELCVPLQGRIAQCQREKRVSVFNALQELSKGAAFQQVLAPTIS